MGFFLNLAFTLIEIAGGLWTGSIAILADALHDLGDSLSLGLAWALEHYSHKKRDQRFSFGYRRFSLLSALISGMVIFSGSVLIIRESLPRFWAPQEPSGRGMMLLAIVGLAVNGAAALRLGRGKSQNEHMLSWHFWEDALGWLATLIGAALIAFFHWSWVDPLLAVGVALFIMIHVIQNLTATLRLLLQGSPQDFSEALFLEELQKVPGLHAVHDLHIWSLDGAQHVLSLHAVLELRLKELFSENIRVKRDIQRIARSHGVCHLTIETEFLGEECVDNCDEDPIK